MVINSSTKFENENIQLICFFHVSIVNNWVFESFVPNGAELLNVLYMFSKYQNLLYKAILDDWGKEPFEK